ncbi:MAG TPA: hypothetical protein ENJ19_02555 [Gammaproteobacteria bacterium]|nr:hypothetical protein [Gammaproteobacteria bacterium]
MNAKHFLATATLSLAFTATGAHGFEGVSRDLNTQLCYGQAMVGFDSVINSRLGVAPDKVLHLAAYQQGIRGVNAPHYSSGLLKVIYGAYLWSGNPHDYAINVFYQCAARRNATLEAFK